MDLYPSLDFPFNVRVYGILLLEAHLLLSHEMHQGRTFTKFPGGGLEFGEGVKDCIIREFQEETGLVVEVEEHVYTTDFYQASAFNSGHQIISIYYYVNCALNFSELNSLKSLEDSQTFSWQNINSLSAEAFTFPIDQFVFSLLKTS